MQHQSVGSGLASRGVAGSWFGPYDVPIMLQLPLWTVTEHVEISESASDPDIVLGTALAFSTSSKLYQFLSTTKPANGRWKWPVTAMA